MSSPSTGFRLKLLLRHGVIFGLTSSLQSALSFILLPLYANYLSLEEFGNYNLLLVWAGALNTVFGLGASSALGRYYYEEKNAGYEKEVVSASLLISMFGSLLLISLALLFARPISTLYFHDVEMRLPIIICLMANALSYPTTTLTLILRYKKRSVFYSIVTVLSLLLNFCITITLLSRLNAGIVSPFMGQTASQIIVLLVLLWYERENITLRFSKEHYSLIFIFGMQVILNAFLAYIYECSDKMIMKEILSTEDVGIYSLSTRIGSIFRILVYLPFVLIWTPLRMEFKDTPDNKTFVSKINNYYTIFGCIFIIMCMVWGFDILKVLFPQPEYAISLVLFPICLISNMFLGYQSIYDFGIYINNKLYYQSIICILMLIFNVVMNILLLPDYGIIASTYIGLITYILTDILLLSISNHYYTLPIEWGKMLCAFAITVGVYLLYFMSGIEVIHNVFLKSFVTLAVGLFSWFVLFNSSERKHAKSIVKRFVK